MFSYILVADFRTNFKPSSPELVSSSSSLLISILISTHLVIFFNVFFLNVSILIFCILYLFILFLRRFHLIFCILHLLLCQGEQQVAIYAVCNTSDNKLCLSHCFISVIRVVLSRYSFGPLLVHSGQLL